MVKIHSTISIENGLTEEAKKRGINISEAAETGLREALGKVKVEINTTIKKCEFCGKEGEKAKASDYKAIEQTSEMTAEELEKHKKLLIWLYPDEKWICEACLDRKSRYL